jgi:hypothetical protein
MALTFFDLVAGRFKQLTAIITSSGAVDANKIIGSNAAGKIDVTFLPDGIGADARTRTASEAINAGSIGHIHTGGTVRNADATAEGREARCFVLGAITNGATGEVRFDGTITGLSGLTEGAAYFMSETPGQITDTPVSGAGKVHQYVGFALSATELSFEPGEPVTLA